MWIVLAVSSAFAGTCTEITASDILAVPPPAVIVLGERPGVARDGRRSGRIVRRLLEVAPVTVALEGVLQRAQPTLDEYARGEIPTERLEERLDWETDVALPYAGFEGLVTASLHGANVVAIGSQEWSPPADINVPISTAYLDILRDGMGSGQMPRTAEGDFLRFVAWRDHELAERALTGWGGDGYLVIAAHRARVEGGFGIPWQAATLTQVPVEAFVMAWGIEPPCYDGDRVWTETFFEKLFGG